MHCTVVVFHGKKKKKKKKGTVTPSVHQEQCNQFYDETERNIYDQIEVCKGTTFSYPLAQ